MNLLVRIIVLPLNIFYNFRHFLKAFMEDPYCPNYSSCKLVNTVGFTGDEQTRKQYIQVYCEADESKWNNCKRLIVKEKFHFCPDFVMPDTNLSPDEIIDKFDDENLN